MSIKKSQEEILKLFHKRAEDLTGIASQLFIARMINLGLSNIPAKDFLSQFDSPPKPEELFSIEKIEKIFDYMNSAEWVENWIRRNFNGKVIVEKIPNLKFSDISSCEKLDNDCWSLAFLFVYFSEEKDFLQKTIKEQLSWFHTMDKKAIELINLGNQLLGYWMVELVRRFRKKKNVMPRTKKRLQNEADIKMLLQKKFKGVASRKMRLEAMVKTGLGERSVKNKIKKIRSLEST